MNTEKIEQLLRTYVLSAASYGEAIKDGDAEESDRHFEQVEKCFVELKGEGQRGLQAIARLLNSDNEGVRLWASAHLLNYPEYGSYSVLEHLKQSPSILALTAEVTLDQWVNGKISY